MEKCRKQHFYLFACCAYELSGNEVLPIPFQSNIYLSGNLGEFNSHLRQAFPSNYEEKPLISISQINLLRNTHYHASHGDVM